MNDESEELLLLEHDIGWGRKLPVTLITYPNGSQDLHRQTGTEFEQAVDKAKVILAARGLTVGEIAFIGMTGAYMPVTKQQ